MGKAKIKIDRVSKSSIYLSDMSKCRPSKVLAWKSRKGCWRLIEYKAENISGTLLYTAPDSSPPSVRLPLDLKGWHKIYLGIWKQELSNFCIRIRLSSAPSFVSISPGQPSFKTQSIEEGFWKCAKLDGEDLIIAPAKGLPRASSLAYVKVIPLSKEEMLYLKEQRMKYNPNGLIAMCDGFSFIHENRPTTKEEIWEQIEPYRDSDFKSIYWCIGAGGDMCTYPTKVGRLIGQNMKVFPRPGDKNVSQSAKILKGKRIDLMKTARDYAQRIGLEFHISQRMGAFALDPPFDEIFTGNFYLSHPEWHCQDKDGTPVVRMSYAYQGVQEFMLSMIDEFLHYNPDGINLIWVRGIPFLLYEQPLIEGFRKKFGKDPRMLPEDNYDWIKYRADHITEFMRKVRQKANRWANRKKKPISVSAIVLSDPKENLFYGLDVENWIKQDLIDVIIPCKNSYITKEIDKGFFQQVTDKQKCSWYGMMQYWNRPREFPLFFQDAKDFYKAGAKGLCFWDTESYHTHLPIWSIVKQLGDEKRAEQAAKQFEKRPSDFPIYSVGEYQRVDKYPPSYAY